MDKRTVKRWIQVWIDDDGTNSKFDESMTTHAMFFFKDLIDTIKKPTKANIARAIGTNRQERVARVLRALGLEEYRAQVYERKLREG